MNKQELIERIDKLPYVEGPIADTVTVNREWILKSIEQLDEPQKVTVPQFVGDFIAEQKKLGHMLSYSIDACMSDIVAEWYWDNSELFARAWLDGYEVEKEKWYTVKMRATKQPLFYNNMYEKIFFSLGELATRFTRKELEEAGFGWVFDCEGIEIEEVEDDSN